MNFLSFEEGELFTKKKLWLLMIPVMIEQLLNSLMGMFDTMMVTRVGSEAVSAVSLVDAINSLVIQVFAALAAGGTIICSLYLGAQKREKAKAAANQIILIAFLLSVVLSGFCLVKGKWLLSVVFGSVDELIMTNARTYFFFSAISYPFVAHFNSSSAVFRAQGNTKTPMKISIISNVLNVVGNAILIFGFHMGVAGAAIATLISRAFCAITVSFFLARKENTIRISEVYKIRPDGKLIAKVLKIAVPSGIENGMFQFGRLVVQSTVSKMGTVAIAAQAMANTMEGLSGILPIGMGISLMTVVGTCLGAGREEEAKKNIFRVVLWSEAIIIVCLIVIYLAAKPITDLAGMEKEAQDLFLSMFLIISVVKAITWVPSFMPAYGLRAAGDVSFSMIVSIVTMWSCRILLCVTLAARGMGPMAVWYGMFTDWAVRSVIFAFRLCSGRWLKHKAG